MVMMFSALATQHTGEVVCLSDARRLTDADSEPAS